MTSVRASSCVVAAQMIEVAGCVLETDGLGYLHRLFPHGDGPELCKIAGMTMPRKVMLDV